MAEAPHIVIVGAGFGGQGVCHGLGQTEASVTVIDPRDCISVAASWHYQLADRGAAAVVPLSITTAGKIGTLRANSVTQLDANARSVTLDDGDVLTYSHLVLATGVQSDPSSIPGLAECATDITDFSCFGTLKQQIDSIAEGSSIHIAISKCPYTCPPFPFELSFLIDESLRTRGVRDSCQILITSPVPWPFGGPGAEKVFKAAMEAKGIQYKGSCGVSAMQRNDDGKVLTSFSGDENADVAADTVFATFPHRAPAFLADNLNPKAFVPVNLQTNRVTKGLADDDNRVFCVGDACHAVMPAVGAPIPKVRHCSSWLLFYVVAVAAQCHRGLTVCCTVRHNGLIGLVSWQAGEFAWQSGVAVGQLLSSILKGEAETLPDTRCARCIVDAGYGNSIVVQPDFSAAIVDPENGKPKMKVEALHQGHQCKVDFVNRYLQLFTGGVAEQFEPTVGPSDDPTWAAWN